MKTAIKKTVEFDKPSHRLAAHAQKTKSGYDYQQLIEKKAYELYENRGRTDGCDLEDWFQAEKLVKEELGQ